MGSDTISSRLATVEEEAQLLRDKLADLERQHDAIKNEPKSPSVAASTDDEPGMIKEPQTTEGVVEDVPAASADARSIYIGNLSPSTRVEDIHTCLQGCGRIKRITIVRDIQTRRSKGYESSQVTKTRPL